LKCDIQTNRAHFYIPLFLWKGRGQLNCILSRVSKVWNLTYLTV
jgi:hypothetical protein